MAYVLVEDFRAGLDTRRTNVTSVLGSWLTHMRGGSFVSFGETKVFFRIKTYRKVEVCG